MIIHNIVSIRVRLTTSYETVKQCYKLDPVEATSSYDVKTCSIRNVGEVLALPTIPGYNSDNCNWCSLLLF